MDETCDPDIRSIREISAPTPREIFPRACSAYSHTRTRSYCTGELGKRQRDRRTMSGDRRVEMAKMAERAERYEDMAKVGISLLWKLRAISDAH